MSAGERFQSVECKPDMATLTTGTVNFGESVFMNSRALVETFARLAHKLDRPVATPAEAREILQLHSYR